MTFQLEHGEDSWLHDHFPAIASLREMFAFGLRSYQDEPSGWNAFVAPVLPEEASWLGATGGTDASFLVPYLPLYSIRAPETVVLQVTGAVVKSARTRLSSPSRMVVQASSGLA